LLDVKARSGNFYFYKLAFDMFLK